MAARPQFLMIHCFSFFLLLVNSSYSQSNQLERGKSTTKLNSANGLFTLAVTTFGLPGSLQRSYLTISYADAIPIYRSTLFQRDYGLYLWVGNADNPIINDTTRLEIDSQGSLKIVPDGGSKPFVLYAVEALTNASATLQDDGNLVLQETDMSGTSSILWQSFDHPTNVLLPGMKIGINHKTGENWSLTSWRSDGIIIDYTLGGAEAEPAKGSFTFGIEPDSKDQLIIWRRGVVYWKSGKWKDKDNLLRQLDTYNFRYTSNENETYFSYSVMKRLFEPSALLVITDEGRLQDRSISEYKLVDCTNHYTETLLPESPGCTEQNPKLCKKSTAKQRVFASGGFKFPESENFSLADCKTICLSKCSCVAFASTSIRRTGCEIWSSRASFKGSIHGRLVYLVDEGVEWSCWLSIAFGAFILLVGVVFMIWIICLRFQEKGDGYWIQKMILRELGDAMSSYRNKKVKDQERERNELQVFSFEAIAAATNYFSRNNKLGEGGYGPVYKGTLPDGQEIAIKRLSRTSGQGIIEFKNEAVLIAKLQHTNLVRLLGLCIQGEEKILVYEYMSNKSLDFFIFDSERSSALRWRKRFAIIEGIVQGLLYLHKYSRLRVVHRDLKAGNILLNSEMSPKISDFGLARIFGAHENEANTRRVVGTHGYMPPEYVFCGNVSTKTDVFSFGVLLLEIISGKKNNSLYHSEHLLSLTGYAWQLWNDGRALELIDPALHHESCFHNETLRCIHVGLLCVQEKAKDRPEMLEVVSFLSHLSIPIPSPKQPAFFSSLVREKSVVSEINEEACSINQVTMTVIEAR